MQKFLKSLLQDKTLISPTGLNKMLNLIDDYGLGISAEDTSSGLYYTHSGDASGYSGQYYIDEFNNMVIILTNCDETKFIDKLSDKVYQRLSREKDNKYSYYRSVSRRWFELTNKSIQYVKTLL